MNVEEKIQDFRKRDYIMLFISKNSRGILPTKYYSYSSFDDKSKYCDEIKK